MIARLMREGFGASVNTCKTCSIRARLLCFYLRRERNTSFWHCWWSTFSSKRKFSLHSPFFYSLENGQSCSGMAINDLLSFISFFILRSFILLFVLYFSSILLPFNHFPRSDVNECTDVIASCGLGAECINLNGSFDCRCREGFQKIEDNCAGHTTVIPFILPVYFPYKPKEIWVRI